METPAKGKKTNGGRKAKGARGRSKADIEKEMDEELLNLMRNASKQSRESTSFKEHVKRIRGEHSKDEGSVDRYIRELNFLYKDQMKKRWKDIKSLQLRNKKLTDEQRR